jgi:uncharacterized membrane protein YbhN (UPF0104 family)
MDDAETTNGQDRRSGVLGIVRLAILVILLVFVGVYAHRHWEKYRQVKLPPFGAVAWVLLLEGVVYSWYALMLRSLMWPYGMAMGVIEAGMVGMATRFGNVFLPMRGGAALRAAYLNRRHGLAPTQFLAGLAGAMMAPLAVSGVVCALGLLWLWHTGADVKWVYIGLLAAVPVVVGVLALWAPAIDPGQSKLRGMVARILGGWRDLCRHPRAVRTLFVTSVLHLLTLSGIFAVLFSALGIDVSYGSIVLITAMGNASNIFMVTPGNLGVYETVFLMGAWTVGVPTEQRGSLLLVVGVWRALDIVFVAITGGISTIVLKRAVAANAKGKA